MPLHVHRVASVGKVEPARLGRRIGAEAESAVGASRLSHALVGVLDTTALIAVPDDFTKEIVESRARDYLVKALTEQVGREVRLAVTVDTSLREC